jgi:hypothetical protein
MGANQLRLYFSVMAYVLVSGLRRLGLKATDLAQAQVSTIRTKLLKIGAQVRISARRVWISMASSSPWQSVISRYGQICAVNTAPRAPDFLRNPSAEPKTADNAPPRVSKASHVVARHRSALVTKGRLGSGVSYQFSKSIDNAGTGGRGQGGTPIAQNWLDYGAERGLSGFDARHNVSIQAQYSTGMGRAGGHYCRAGNALS